MQTMETNKSVNKRGISRKVLEDDIAVIQLEGIPDKIYLGQTATGFEKWKPAENCQPEDKNKWKDFSPQKSQNLVCIVDTDTLTTMKETSSCEEQSENILVEKVDYVYSNKESILSETSPFLKMLRRHSVDKSKSKIKTVRRQRTVDKFLSSACYETSLQVNSSASPKVTVSENKERFLMNEKDKVKPSSVVNETNSFMMKTDSNEKSEASSLIKAKNKNRSLTVKRLGKNKTVKRENEPRIKVCSASEEEKSSTTVCASAVCVPETKLIGNSSSDNDCLITSKTILNSDSFNTCSAVVNSDCLNTSSTVVNGDSLNTSSAGVNSNCLNRSSNVVTNDGWFYYSMRRRKLHTYKPRSRNMTTKSSTSTSDYPSSSPSPESTAKRIKSQRVSKKFQQRISESNSESPTFYNTAGKPETFALKDNELKQSVLNVSSHGLLVSGCQLTDGQYSSHTLHVSEDQQPNCDKDKSPVKLSDDVFSLRLSPCSDNTVQLAVADESEVFSISSNSPFESLKFDIVDHLAKKLRSDSSITENENEKVSDCTEYLQADNIGLTESVTESNKNKSLILEQLPDHETGKNKCTCDKVGDDTVSVCEKKADEKDFDKNGVNSSTIQDDVGTLNQKQQHTRISSLITCKSDSEQRYNTKNNGESSNIYANDLYNNTSVDSRELELNSEKYPHNPEIDICTGERQKNSTSDTSSDNEIRQDSSLSDSLYEGGNLKEDSLCLQLLTDAAMITTKQQPPLSICGQSNEANAFQELPEDVSSLFSNRIPSFGNSQFCDKESKTEIITGSNNQLLSLTNIKHSSDNRKIDQVTETGRNFCERVVDQTLVSKPFRSNSCCQTVTGLENQITESVFSSDIEQITNKHKSEIENIIKQLHQSLITYNSDTCKKNLVEMLDNLREMEACTSSSEGSQTDFLHQRNVDNLSDIALDDVVISDSGVECVVTVISEQMVGKFTPGEEDFWLLKEALNCFQENPVENVIDNRVHEDGTYSGSVATEQKRDNVEETDVLSENEVLDETKTDSVLPLHSKTNSEIKIFLERIDQKDSFLIDDQHLVRRDNNKSSFWKVCYNNKELVTNCSLISEKLLMDKSDGSLDKISLEPKNKSSKPKMKQCNLIRTHGDNGNLKIKQTSNKHCALKKERGKGDLKHSFSQKNKVEVMIKKKDMVTGDSVTCDLEKQSVKNPDFEKAITASELVPMKSRRSKVCTKKSSFKLKKLDHQKSVSTLLPGLSKKSPQSKQLAGNSKKSLQSKQLAGNSNKSPQSKHLAWKSNKAPQSKQLPGTNKKSPQSKQLAWNSNKSQSKQLAGNSKKSPQSKLAQKIIRQRNNLIKKSSPLFPSGKIVPFQDIISSASLKSSDTFSTSFRRTNQTQLNNSDTDWHRSPLELCNVKCESVKFKTKKDDLTLSKSSSSCTERKSKHLDSMSDESKSSINNDCSEKSQLVLRLESVLNSTSDLETSSSSIPGSSTPVPGKQKHHHIVMFSPIVHTLSSTTQVEAVSKTSTSTAKSILKNSTSNILSSLKYSSSEVTENKHEGNDLELRNVICSRLFEDECLLENGAGLGNTDDLSVNSGCLTNKGSMIQDTTIPGHSEDIYGLEISQNSTESMNIMEDHFTFSADEINGTDFFSANDTDTENESVLGNGQNKITDPDISIKNPVQMQSCHNEKSENNSKSETALVDISLTVFESSNDSVFDDNSDVMYNTTVDLNNEEMNSEDLEGYGSQVEGSLLQLSSDYDSFSSCRSSESDMNDKTFENESETVTNDVAGTSSNKEKGLKCESDSRSDGENNTQSDCPNLTSDVSVMSNKENFQAVDSKDDDHTDDDDDVISLLAPSDASFLSDEEVEQKDTKQSISKPVTSTLSEKTSTSTLAVKPNSPKNKNLNQISHTRRNENKSEKQKPDFKNKNAQRLKEDHKSNDKSVISKHKPPNKNYAETFGGLAQQKNILRLNQNENQSVMAGLQLDLPPQVLLNILENSINYGHILRVFQVMKKLYSHPLVLNANLFNRVLRMCHPFRRDCQCELLEMFDRVRKLNIVPDVDCVVSLIRAFIESENWEMMWQVFMYVCEKAQFIIPVRVQEMICQACLNDPDKYGLRGIQWLRVMFREQFVQYLPDVNHNILVDMAELCVNHNERSVALQLKQAISPTEPVTIGLEDEEDVRLVYSDDLQIFACRIQGCSLTKNWRYLAQTYIDICASSRVNNKQLFNIYCQAFFDLKSTQQIVYSFREFLHNVVKKYQRDKHMFRLDWSTIGQIGRTLLFECYNSSNMSDTYTLFLELLKFKLPCRSQSHVLDQHFLAVAMETCIHLEECTLCVQIFEGFCWRAENMSNREELNTFLNLLMKLLNKLLRRADCKNAARMLSLILCQENVCNSEIILGPDFACLQNNLICKAVNIGDMKSAVKMFNLCRSAFFTLECHTLRLLVTSCAETGLLDEARDIFVHCKKLPMYRTAGLTDNPRQLLLCSLLTPAEMLFVIEVFLQERYSSLKSMLHEGQAMTLHELKLSVKIVNCRTDVTIEPYLSIFPKSVPAAQNVVLSVLQKDLSPPLEGTVGSFGVIDINMMTLKMYFQALDQKQVNQHFTRLPLHITQPATTSRNTAQPAFDLRHTATFQRGALLQAQPRGSVTDGGHGSSVHSTQPPLLNKLESAMWIPPLMQNLILPPRGLETIPQLLPTAYNNPVQKHSLASRPRGKLWQNKKDISRKKIKK